MDETLIRLLNIYNTAITKGDLRLAYEIAVTMHQIQNKMGVYRET